MEKKCRPIMGTKNVDRQQHRLDKYVLPVLGDMKCCAITAPKVLGLLRMIEEKGNHDLSHAVAQHISMILRYGIACDYADKEGA